MQEEKECKGDAGRGINEETGYDGTKGKLCKVARSDQMSLLTAST